MERVDKRVVRAREPWVRGGDKRVAAVAGLLALLTAWQAKPAGTGMRIVMHVEALRIRSDGSASRFPHRILPDGDAVFEFTTDGESVRTTLHGRMLGLADGSVALVAAKSGQHITLDPGNRTYYVTELIARGGSAPNDLRVTPTSSYDSILGHKVRCVKVSFTEAIKASDGSSRALLTEIDAWCATDLKVPRVVADAVNMALSFVGRSAGAAYAASCPVVLRSRLRTALTPGLELVWSVTAIESIKTSPDMFTVPRGFKQIPAPGR